MSSNFEFVGAIHPASQRTGHEHSHNSFAQRYQRRLEEARTNHAVMQDLLNGGDHSINQVINRHQLTRNIIILRFVTLASTAAEIGGRRLDARKNNHAVLLDILSKQYHFDEITKYYRINRNVMIMCLADVAEEAVAAANAIGCDDDRLFRVMAYNNRGSSLSVADSIARVKREDREKKVKAGNDGAESEWVVV